MRRILKNPFLFFLSTLLNKINLVKLLDKTCKPLGRITSEEAESFKHLTVVGIVGSIDNDMSSTDITIGAVTSLHRICEAVDSISSTAFSHSRAFVVEVMGRHCGWLGLMAAVRYTNYKIWIDYVVLY